MSLLKKLLHKNKAEQKAVDNSTLQKSAYDFVKQYTLIDPKKLLMTPTAFALCKKIPVAYENGQSNSGWNECVQMDTNVILPFIQLLGKAPLEQIASTKMRTVSIINLDKDKRIYILPNLKQPGTALMEICFDNGDKNSWPFYMTPTIRKAVVEQIKIHTR